MRYLFCVLFLVLFASEICLAGSFTILIADGKVNFQSNNKKNIALQTGDKIGKGTIQIHAQTIFSMIHENGNVVQLTNPGKYETEELEKTILNKEQCPTTKQLATVFLEKYKQQYKAIVRCSPSIVLHLPCLDISSFLENGYTKISWQIDYNRPEKKSYHIQITSIEGDLIFKDSTTEKWYLMNTSPFFSSLHKNLILIVSDGEINASMVLKLASDTLELDYFRQLETLNSELPKNAMATKLLLFGMAAKQHGLFLKEIGFYNELFEILKPFSNMYENPNGLDKFRMTLTMYRY